MMNFIIIIFCLLFISPSYAELVDSNATTETKALYTQLQNAQGKYIYWGEYAFVRSDVNATESNVYKITGKQPFVLGLDYEDSWGLSDSVTYPGGSVEAKAKTHYRNGGIIAMNWHMKNWVTGGNCQDRTGNPVVNILPGGTARSTYLAKLDEFASWCNNFTDDRGNLIPIVFRPFHENDQYGFWWGPSTCTDAQFVSLWKDLVEYLRDTKGVHNLLYVYCPQLANDTPNYVYTQYDGSLYPGDDYVDIFGISRYCNLDNLTTWDNQNVLTCYQNAYDSSVSHNKVFIISEGMRDLQDAPKSDYWTWYSNQILNDSKAKNSAFVMNWHTPTNITNDRWGALDGSADEADYLLMSQNPKIKMLQYYNTHIYNATIRNATFN